MSKTKIEELQIKKLELEIKKLLLETSPIIQVPSINQDQPEENRKDKNFRSQEDIDRTDYTNYPYGKEWISTTKMDKKAYEQLNPKTMPDKLYNILYEKSEVQGVRVLYEEDFPLDELVEFIQQEIDRAREETLNDFWTYFDEGKSELLELEDKGHMSLEEIEWDFGEERFKEYINKLTI